ncbi:GAF domain-containing protein [Streptomyces sp. NPDC059679]|uniref:GAF domain-containing protein n=1 Tax=Streptomyces sp. NPDC059679 TaxID=3346903 RepID=UPI003673B923
MIEVVFRWTDSGGPEEWAALEAAHEQFLNDRIPMRAVRDCILASWRRSRSLGVEAEDPGWLYNEDLDTQGLLTAAAQPVLDELEIRLGSQRVALAICDGQGMVIQRRVRDSALGRLFREALLIPGFGFPERTSGTNGIGTALAERRPVYIAGPEHFAHAFDSFTCAAAPVREPLSGRIEGVLDITSLRTDAAPPMLDYVRAAATAIERRLLERSTRRERVAPGVRPGEQTYFQAIARHRTALGHARQPGPGHLVGDSRRVDRGGQPGRERGIDFVRRNGDSALPTHARCYWGLACGGGGRHRGHRLHRAGQRSGQGPPTARHSSQR